MTSEQNLPTGLVLETERTTHDEVMGRDYTTVRYRQEHTRSAVYINEVIDGENVWKYSVHHSGGTATLEPPSTWRQRRRWRSHS
ncbi:hypothetical protein SAMN04487948_11687 [Halogranum amylolyticum]|uniref:Uncharacterized protein n=1 Tax=Halogranum amylolyticum TaxID=660520 RepID=A0A1H8VGR3_9EURY|nr:hypothetical protein SAMN04487948_11687 [Halogranum amylolyticum]